MRLLNVPFDARLDGQLRLSGELKTWETLYKSLRGYHRSLVRNFRSSRMKPRKRKSKLNHLMKQELLVLCGVYTDGGCDGRDGLSKARFWVDNLFIPGRSRHYCSERSEAINTLAQFIPKYSTEGTMIVAARNKEYRRRKAILWCFSGSRLRHGILDSVDNEELETLLIEAINNNVDELVKLKCRYWERLLRIEKQKRIWSGKWVGKTLVILRRITSTRQFLKFSIVYNNFSRTKTADIVDYVRKYVSLKGIWFTFTFSVDLLLQTLIKYVYFVNHHARLKRVLEVSQRKVRYKNGLLRFKNKLIHERAERVQQMKQLTPVPKTNFFVPVVGRVIARNEEQTELSTSNNLLLASQNTFAVLETFLVQRQKSFTCPVMVGAVMASIADEKDVPTGLNTHIKSLYQNNLSQTLAEATTLAKLKSFIQAGLLPPILEEYKTRSVHIVEFVPVNTFFQPILWFSFRNHAEHVLRLPLRLETIRRSSFFRNFCEDFIYRLERPRLAKYVNVKLISASHIPRQVRNMDCSTATFFGRELTLSSSEQAFG